MVLILQELRQKFYLCDVIIIDACTYYLQEQVDEFTILNYALTIAVALEP